MTTTYETYLDAAKRTLAPSRHDWYTPEAVARRAYNEQSCIFHAAHGQTLEHLAEAGYRPCGLCGGLTHTRQGDHELCRARLERGMAIQPLDSTPHCGCAMCEKRGAQ